MAIIVWYKGCSSAAPGINSPTEKQKPEKGLALPLKAGDDIRRHAQKENIQHRGRNRHNDTVEVKLRNGSDFQRVGHSCQS